MDVFKFTEDQETAFKLIGWVVRNPLLFEGSCSGKTLIPLAAVRFDFSYTMCYFLLQTGGL